MPERELKLNEAILEATDQAMAQDPSIYVMGLGVPDPKGIFGTTSGLEKKYGAGRVLDMPTSENAMTGIAVGTALRGMRPLMTHQRVDFFLLALDQLINNAAKWHYMFGGVEKIPLVIRLIIGRGWGQGPQHSQSLHSIFAHIPGLQVVAPASPYDAKGLLLTALRQNNPVVYLEHRWLHTVFGPVPQEPYQVPFGKARLVCEGSDLTLVASSHMVLEAYQAAEWLKGEGISAEVVDLRTIKPLDEETILESVRKTGHLLVADPDWKFSGFSAEIISCVVEKALFSLKKPPVRIAYPDRFVPTSWALANHFYPGAKEIALAALQMLGKRVKRGALLEDILKRATCEPLDVPDKQFKGPF